MVAFSRCMRLAALLLVAPLFLSANTSRAQDAKPVPAEFKNLQFRNIGPACGGRVSRACGVPGDPLTYYAATAAGGVWKSTDGGLNWKAIFDDQPVATIGSIAVAPSDPNVIYVGSGEANIRGNVQPGNGIYKSTDGGKSWNHVWKQVGQIGTMIVHPTNPDVAFAAVLGHAFGPNKERGVYRTTDGGKTWQQVLAKNEDTGASDVCFDPTNPRVLFAGLWQARRKPWEMTSGGPGSGLYVSRDGGDTWTQLVRAPKEDSPEFGKDPPKGQKYCEGLPEGIWGKVCLAVAPSNNKRVYAMIEAEKGGLVRSDDGGDSWSVVNESRAIRQRPWYFSTITVHPTNADEVWFPQVPLLKSTDGGKTLKRVKGPHHGDHHDIWIDPKDPKRIIDSNDGGVDISRNGGETWFAPPLALAQFYHVSVDTQVPYHVMGAVQDIGTAAGPSNSLLSGGIRLTDWVTVGGGEAGFAVADPSDPNVIYAGEYGGYLSRYDRRTRQAVSIGIYPFNPSGHGAEVLKYRFQWTAPVMISPHDPKALYHAANVLFRSTDDGRNWKAVSPDLTRNDKTKQQWSGGPITGDNTGVEVYGTVFALAESPKQKGLLWAGSDDGLVHVSRDDGKTWDNVTKNIQGIPEWGTVVCIEPSPFDADTAYVVVDAHRLDDYKPYLFKTADGGKTWVKLSDSLPQDVFLRVVREDPRKKGQLYLGTDRGLHYSVNGGQDWKVLKLNFPTVAVCDIVVKDNDLVVGTSGRSIWILDDITPLREYMADLAAKPVHLYPGSPAYRYRPGSDYDEATPTSTFPNPPNGAVLYYSLKAKPKDPITLEVFDSAGKLVRKLTSKEKPKDDDDVGAYSDPEPKKPDLPDEPGLHRVVWDLRYDGATPIKGARIDSGNPRTGPLVNPGTYKLKLTAAGESVTTEVEVKLDPRHKGPAAITPKDLDEQLAFTLKVRDDLGKLAGAVNQMRGIKKQIQSRKELLKEDEHAKELLKAGDEFVKKLDALEEKFHNPKAQVVYDILAQKGGAKLYSQYGFLYSLALSADAAPNQGMREVYAEHAALLTKLTGEWDTLLKEDVAKLNELAKKGDFPVLVIPKKPDILGD